VSHFLPILDPRARGRDGGALCGAAECAAGPHSWPPPSAPAGLPLSPTACGSFNTRSPGGAHPAAGRRRPTANTCLRSLLPPTFCCLKPQPRLPKHLPLPA
jgi:hypothetical protein